ncbi:hypothetical protein [Brachyspira hampsonii]|uniref:Lipoprotein n=1 Tax=Brachyspira hampsonii 30446 TaxID=1289135 RepID=A0A2U4F589_9SPIR|nr:hypothetical protein [Brachyspira hampsonii]EKV56130.1 hypothetical protein A966_12246 [Brachyspira hampsonii 30446]MBW5388906.1 hypothetical protein [Brachyspira hampsonii]MBW5395230.1 hypothetical protein [Brachyspira hampsonii]OEJ18030.1 hypothetical protein A9495_06375 [Brachyspira hampsonii]
MNKKILLTIFISLLILNCSATITTPSPENKVDIGDGSFIDPTGNPNSQSSGIIITDQVQISGFIKNHNGAYYSRYDDNSLGLRYIIDSDSIYNGYGTKVEATMKTLLGNKLQIYIEGKPESSGAGLGYDMNDEMYTFNFGSDGNIYLFANAIFHKENYQKQSGYNTLIGEPISELITYSGNYYYYDYDDTKKYYIIIDTAGQVYMDDNFKINYSKAELSNSVLIITYKQTGGTSSRQELHFYDKDGNQDYKLIFGNTWINNQLQYETLIKYNLFSPYSGTYKSVDSSITLTITTTDAQLNTVPYSYTPVIIGNTLTIYQYSSREGTKVHKFVFNNDKSKAVYTKPDGTAIELNK